MADPAIDQFRRTRDRVEKAIASLRPQMEAWLAAHEDENVTMLDLAALEGLNATRDRLGQEIQRAQIALIEALRHRVEDT